MPTIIRAARLHQHGRPVDVEEIELPEPAGDQVLVNLQFGGVNPVDTYMAKGQVAPDGPLPRTLGGEASGTAEGRQVLVAGGGLGSERDGVWAQAAVVSRRSVLELPEGVEPRGAAAMGIAGLTAWNCVHDLGAVRAEDRVLVLGASGGVGTMIVSLSSAVGAQVRGQTGSREKADVIERLGAEQAIVAGAEDLFEAIDGFEPTIVFDPLGDGFVQPVIEALIPGGRLVSFGTSAGPQATFNLRMLYRKGIKLLGYADRLVGPQQRRAGLRAALEAIRAGDLTVGIDEVLPLEEVGQAFERLPERKGS